MRTADGYIRVSKVMGRSGESFISPDEQRAAIEAWALSTKTTILEWHTDLDQSGGTLDRPAFTAALERCRAGLTGGIVAAKLDRLTRSVVGLPTILDDANEHGYNVVAVDLGLDMHTPNGELVAGVLVNVAQWERKRRGEDWEAARRNAIARGIPNGRAPFGYRKVSGGRLEVVDKDAREVRTAFKLRADGVPFAEIGRRYGWSHSTTRQLLANVAYLGVARAGSFVNVSAHPAIVSEEEFRAANAARTHSPAAAGATTKDRLLLGLARCAGCNKTLKMVRRKRVDGSYVDSYFCKNAATQLCSERAYVHADDLDEFVAEWFTQALSEVPRMVDAVAQTRDLEQAQDEQEKAESGLYAYVEAASALDAPLFQRGVQAREKAVEKATQKVRELSGRVTRLPSGGTLLDLWSGFETSDRRDVLRGFLGQVLVRRGASSDLAGNVRIEWADGTIAYSAKDKARVRVQAA